MFLVIMVFAKMIVFIDSTFASDSVRKMPTMVSLEPFNPRMDLKEIPQTRDQYILQVTADRNGPVACGFEDEWTFKVIDGLTEVGTYDNESAECNDQPIDSLSSKGATLVFFKGKKLNELIKTPESVYRVDKNEKIDTTAFYVISNLWTKQIKDSSGNIKNEVWLIHKVRNDLNTLSVKWESSEVSKWEVENANMQIPDTLYQGKVHALLKIRVYNKSIWLGLKNEKIN